MAFRDAIGTDARWAVFTENNQVGGDLIHQQTNVYAQSASLEKLLETYVVPDAAYNRRGPRTRCLEGTRELVIGNIMDWIGGDDDRPICWFYGPAGFGKSAIAQTIAEKCAEDSILAASFFFKRGAGDRARIMGFIPTLSYQLTLSLPGTKLAIQTVLQNDPTIPHQSLEDQLKKLIINPVLGSKKPIRRMVIIIDALDECDDKADIAEFIEILLRTSRARQLPFLFLVTGRAENHILQRFSPPETQSTTYCLALHEFDAHRDIHTFLLSQFATVLVQNPRLMQGVESPWPSAADIEGLVKKSSGLFIFASTLVDFVTDGRGSPQRKLETVLMTHAGLDPLYAQVFSAACRDDPFEQVIGGIMVLREQLSITNLGRLLQLRATDILQVTLGIQSILRIPEDDDKAVELIHASLRDFLVEQRRSGVYFINPPIPHAFIAVRCLKIIMEDAGTKMVAKSSAALYACRNWCHHLDAASIEGDGVDGGNTFLGADLTRCLEDFKSRSLDHWINTLIHASNTRETVQSLRRMISRLKQSRNCPKGLLRTLKDIDKISKRDFVDFESFVRFRSSPFGVSVFVSFGPPRSVFDFWPEENIVGWRQHQDSQWLLTRAAKQLFQ